MNCFIVDTSFQMLCAIEAREAMAKGEQNHLIIEGRGALEGRDLNLRQIVALDDGGWASVNVSVFPRRKGAYRSGIRLLKLLRVRLRIGRAKCLFVGTMSTNWAIRMARIFGADTRVRLDDGTASLAVLQALRTDKSKSNWSAFTMFHRLTDGPHIMPNTFNVLRAKANPDATIDPSLTWVIGGAYTEAKLLSWNRELAALRWLADQHVHATLVYLPHRADADQKLADLRNMGFLVAASGQTFETRLLTADILPGCIAGISSTALITARILKPGLKIMALRLCPAPKPIYDDIFDEAAALGIEVMAETAGT